MITQCTTIFQRRVLSYIGDDYYKCLYLYIDMQQYGCSSEFTQTWLQEDNGEITAVMLAYHNAMHVYSKNLSLMCKNWRNSF